MALIDVVKKSVKIQIKAKAAIESAIDDVLEPALQKVVADTSNKFDDTMMAMVYPGLEVELKKAANEKVDQLIAKLPAIVRDVIEIV